MPHHRLRLTISIVILTPYAGCSYSPPDIEGIGGAGASSGLSSSASTGAGGMMASPNAILCGANECTGHGIICCLDPDIPENSKCMPDGDCGFIRTLCDSHEDCPNGDICCGFVDVNQVTLTEIKCATECTGTNRTMCKVDNDTSTTCSSPMQCQDDVTIAQPGYGFCSL